MGSLKHSHDIIAATNNIDTFTTTGITPKSARIFSTLLVLLS